MRLNPDCVRDLLFAIEKESTANSLFLSDSLSEYKNISKYSQEEILYHLQQLDWSGYIVTPSKNKSLDGSFIIQDLSPLGHEFLSNIRQDTNWNKVKNISKEVGSETLTSIKSIAENVIASAIKASMGLG